MSEYIINLPNGGAADECIRLRGYEKSLYGYELHEEIVRCRDCKHYKDRNGAILPGTVCQRLGYYNFKVEPDGFCKWASRRES